AATRPTRCTFRPSCDGWANEGRARGRHDLPQGPARMSDLGTTIALDPLIGWLPLYILGGVALAAVLLGAVLRARGTILRLVAAALVWLILANPSLVVE